MGSDHEREDGPGALERDLGALRAVVVPHDLCGAVVQETLRRRRRFGAKQAMALLASLSAWAMVIHALVAWTTGELGKV